MQHNTDKALIDMPEELLTPPTYVKNDERIIAIELSIIFRRPIFHFEVLGSKNEYRI